MIAKKASCYIVWRDTVLNKGSHCGLNSELWQTVHISVYSVRCLLPLPLFPTGMELMHSFQTFSQTQASELHTYKFLVPCSSVRVKLKTSKLMEKSRTLGTNIAFCMLPTFERSKYPYQFVCFDRNFDHPHINVVAFAPRKQSKRPHFVEKVFDTCC